MIGTDISAKPRRALRLTRLGLLAERMTRAFWPVWSILFALTGALTLGLQDALALEVVWGIGVFAVLALIYSMYRGLRRFKWPSATDALDRLDATMPGRPLATLQDSLAIGSEDPQSAAVWDAHRARLRAQAETAQAVLPSLNIARFDPFALRYVAMLVLATGVLFGSFLRIGEVTELTPGQAEAAIGPSWEGWAEPPRYSGLPTIYLPDVDDPEIALLRGSRITIRTYGDVGALTVFETVSIPTEEVAVASASIHSFDVDHPGEIAIDGPGGRTWRIAMAPDLPPTVDFTVTIDQDADFTPAALLEQSFTAQDDFAVVAGQGRIALLLDQVDRRHGLSIAPEPRDDLLLELPMTIAGDRSDFTETMTEDLSQHPWANLPVSLTLEVEDAIGQTGLSDPKPMLLPGRRFFDPLAKAVIEQRRDLLWSRENALRITQVIRALTHQADGMFRTEVSRLRLNKVLRRIEALAPYGISDEQQDELAQALWDLAVQLEEGDLADAAQRLQRAQERLEEAIRNGATEDEIAELMQELRDAMQDYMQQLAESQDPNQQSQPTNPENMQQLSQRDLQDMLDQLQELMEQGRMAEAQELLQQLQQMMENMQVTEGQQGQQGQPSEGEQAMEGLAETLRDQQGLSDEAFRDLQEQFNPNSRAGESSENRGRAGSQGQGQQHSEEQGQQGQGESQGQSGQNPGETQEQSLANRQQALRNQLQQQRQNLPGAGTPEGDAAREALDQAGRAMDDAEQALRENDLAEAIDNQAEAMDALRDGMQRLGEAIAQQQQQNGQGQQNQQAGGQPPQRTDPLGRNPTGQGPSITDEQYLNGEDVNRKAEELLDEIRRRSAEADRSEDERNYLNRLLDRF